MVRLKRLLAVALSVLLCALAAEIATRAFWSLRFGVPFRDPGKILYAYYPELERVDEEGPSRADDEFDVLLLGGSVLHRDWSAVEQHLQERLSDGGRRRVRVFNLAQASHTSRDSWLKYRALGEARFDLVVFYHGINETRANNAPPDVYREDYGHFSWYEIVNAMAPFHGDATFALPLTLRWAYVSARLTLSRDRHVPAADPRQDWLGYGGDVKSAASLGRNLESLVGLTEGRGDPVLLMTFAIFVPENYTRDAFLEKRLGYGLHFSPIELWGLPENVIPAVAAHNAVVRELAARHGTMFVDQAALMDDIHYFNDVCHFTTVGSVRFADNMLDDPGGVGRITGSP